MKSFKLLVVALIGLLVIAACTSTEPAVEVVDSAETTIVEEAAAETSTDEAMEEDDSMMEDDEAMMEDDEAMMEDDEAMMEEDEAMMEEESHDDSMMEEGDKESDEAMMEEGDKESDEAMMEEGDKESDEAMMEEGDKESDEAMMEEASHDGDKESDEAMMEEDEAMAESESMAERPAWQQIAFTNAATGESFTFADFAGKTVFVEPMATWCTNCRSQLNNVLEAKSQFGDDVVVIGLSIETTLSNADLASYATSNGYDAFTWAVMTPESLQALAGVFGQSVANPPSTPHFIIAADGSYTELDTGLEDSAELVEQISSVQ